MSHRTRRMAPQELCPSNRLEVLEDRRHWSATAIAGTAVGSSGSYRNQGNTAANAVDGNLNTFFDGTGGNGQWTGIDAGTTGSTSVTEVSYAPRPGFAKRMVGGVFQASTSADFSTGTVDLYTVSAAPAYNVLTTVPVTAGGTYEYFRYLGPNGSFGNVAEVQFADDPAVSPVGSAPPPVGVPTSPILTSPTATATPIIGTTVGSSGSYRNQGNTIAKATDGNLNTFFDGAYANGQWVGLDVGYGGTATVTQVSFAPRQGWAKRMVGGLFQVSNAADFSAGTVTLYTITAVPTYGKLTAVAVASPGGYRYARYLSPNGGYGNVAEVQFAGTQTAPPTAPTPSPSPTITGWETKTPSPVQRAEAVGTAVGGVVYVFGGLTNDGSFDTSIPLLSRCDAYDPTTDTWTRLADFPEPFSHSEPVVVGTGIWFVGGYVGNHPGPGTTHVWVYDTTDDSWSRGPDLPQARGAGAAAVIGDTIYFTGGMDATRTTDEGTTWALDLDNRAAGWVQKADLPNPRNHVAAAAVDGYLYVLGGQHGQETNQAAQAEVDRYDPSTDTWTPMTSIPSSAGKSHITSGTFAYGGKIIVVGGEVGYDIPQRSVMSYDPVTNAWTQIGTLPQVRSTVVAGIVDGRLVVTTGNGPDATDTTWVGTFSS